MKDWHSNQETPYTQAEDQMWAVLGKFRYETRLRKGRQDLIQGHVFIGLPFITRAEWRDEGLDLSPASPLTIIFADAKLRYRVIYRCGVCGQVMEVTSKEEKEAINEYMLAQGWAHTECLERR